MSSLIGLAAGVLSTLPPWAAAQITPADVAPPTETAAEEALKKPPPKRGLVRVLGVDVIPRASASAIYDDNVNIGREGQRQSDLTWMFTPGFTALAGDEDSRALTLTYTPSLNLYTSHGEYNNVGQLESFKASWLFSKLTLGLSQSYDQSLRPVSDIGNLTEYTLIRGGLSAKYEFTDRTSVEVLPEVSTAEYGKVRHYTGQLYNSQVWSVASWLNRQVTGKITASIGAMFGLQEVDRSPSQNFEQALVRGIYRLAAKVDLTAAAGLEWRQYQSGRAGSMQPVLSIAGTWQPVEGTAITLEAHSQVVSSALYGDANYTRTGFTLSTRRRLLERFYVEFSGAYDLAEYESSVTSANYSRTDNNYSVRGGVGAIVTTRWTTGVFYQYYLNDSQGAQGTYNYDRSQIGIQAEWKY